MSTWGILFSSSPSPFFYLTSRVFEKKTLHKKCTNPIVLTIMELLKMNISCNNRIKETTHGFSHVPPSQLQIWLLHALHQTKCICATHPPWHDLNGCYLCTILLLGILEPFVAWICFHPPLTTNYLCLYFGMFVWTSTACNGYDASKERVYTK